MFGKILKESRLKAGMGLREVAGRVGISPGYLSDLENEKVPPPSEKVILDMAFTLGVDKGELLKAASKVDPELSEYVAQEPRAADFLRMAKEQGYRNGDWDKLTQLVKIMGLGEDKEKKP
jgi:HTH-type transcriptional regulator, competence development regulator